MSRLLTSTHPRRQQGAVLIVVLILLLVMTLLGLASLRGTLMEERMSGSLYDRNLSFQAAEAALREAEAEIAKSPTFPTGGACNSNGLCDTPDATKTDRWRDSAFTNWKKTSVNLGTLTATPEYIIEYMGKAPVWPGCDQVVPMSEFCIRSRFRITARSAAADRARVMLQTTYAGP